MGLLVDGVWVDQWYDTKTSGGRFERERAKFHDRIDVGGRFAPEAGRYRLYVSWACPWAQTMHGPHRIPTLLKLVDSAARAALRPR